MNKIDIELIIDLYEHLGVKPSMISRKSYIHFSYYRIKNMIQKLEDIREVDGNLPENYAEIIFQYTNRWQFDIEKCNEFCVEKLQTWIWKNRESYSLETMTSKLKKLAQQENLPIQTISKTKIQDFMRRLIGTSYKKPKKTPYAKTKKSHHRLRNTWILQFLLFTEQ